MTTRQLADMRLSAARLRRTCVGLHGARRGRPGVETIIIVNYICPLGEKGVARVSVTNGVADSVFY